GFRMICWPLVAAETPVPAPAPAAAPMAAPLPPPKIPPSTAPTAAPPPSLAVHRQLGEFKRQHGLSSEPSSRLHFHNAAFNICRGGNGRLFSNGHRR